MSPVHRKLIRRLLSTRSPLLVIGGIIAIGVACSVSMQSTHCNLTGGLDCYYRDSRMADFWIDVKKAPRMAAERIMSVEGVTRAESRIRFLATIA